jgi:ribose 5-phosphate isomerase B
MRSVITVAELAGIADGSELVIDANALITPLARDEAASRGITLRRADPSEKVTAPAARRVALGADHGGYEMKEQLKAYLREWGYAVLDLGTDGPAAVDYPDIAEAVASAVVRGDAWRGVVLDSAGIGSCMAANKVPGARAALCYDRATANNSREHNDANVLSLGAKLISIETAREILAVWLETAFAGGRHQKRVDKIRGIEQRHSKTV